MASTTLMIEKLSINTPGQGLQLITDQIDALVRASGVKDGRSISQARS